MASLNPPIADDLSQLAIPRHAVIVGFAGGSREVLLARRDGMHLDVSNVILGEFSNLVPLLCDLPCSLLFGALLE